MHSRAVKTRRVAVRADFVAAVVKRVGILLGFDVHTFATRAVIIRFLRGELFRTRSRSVEMVSVPDIAARILATDCLLTWSRD